MQNIEQEKYIIKNGNCIYIYIYIFEREREREREKCMNLNENQSVETRLPFCYLLIPYNLRKKSIRVKNPNTLCLVVEKMREKVVVQENFQILKTLISFP